MNSRERVLCDAMELPPSDREILALDLLMTLEKDEDYDLAWEGEITRRVEQVNAGLVELLPGNDVMDRLHQRVRGAGR